MEQIKAVSLWTHYNAPKKIRVKQNGGKSITQPDMVLSIQQVLERSLRGMEVRGYEPIFYGNKNKELVNFENLSQLEKIDFARQFKKAASDAVSELEETYKAKQIAKIEAEKQIKSQTESQKQL